MSTVAVRCARLAGSTQAVLASAFALAALLPSAPAHAQKVELEALEITYGDLVKASSGAKSGAKPNAAVSADVAVQDQHQTGAASADGALVVRRGDFVRAGVEIEHVAACSQPGLLLRDAATGAALRVPVLDRADGLGVTLANQAALEAKGAGRLNEALAHCGWQRDETDPRSGFRATLGGQLDGTVVTAAAAAEYAEAVQAQGTPYYAVSLAREPVCAAGEKAPCAATGLRAAVAVWLPEHMPVGAWTLQVTCGGQGIGSALPLVVLFNPHVTYTAEAMPHGALRQAGLASADQTFAGPLAFDFGIDADDAAARDVALELLAGLPLAARAEPALVARIAAGGPMQLTAGVDAKGTVVAGHADGKLLWFDIGAWNDATGHFDLWQGSSDEILWGRWDGRADFVVVSGSGGHPWEVTGPGTWLQPWHEVAKAVGAPQLGHWGFARGGDGGTAAVGAKGSQAPTHHVVGTVHFVDDWQGETAFLAGGSTGTRLPATRCSWDKTGGLCVLSGLANAKPGADSGDQASIDAAVATKTPAKYGQCWVFSGVLAGKDAPPPATGTADVFARYRRDGGGHGMCEYGKCFCANYLGTALLRNLGLPTRSVTNFDSALAGEPGHPAGVGKHNRALVAVAEDGQGFAAWDYAGWLGRLKDHHDRPIRVDILPDGKIEWRAGQSTWSFHVWNEAWVGRTTAKAGGCGWSALDATPQEVAAEAGKTSPLGAPVVAASLELQGAPAVLVSEEPAKFGTWIPLGGPSKGW